MEKPVITRRGLLLILASPSGAGKTSLSRLLFEHDQEIELSISATTRPPRKSEKDGVDYHFIASAEFEAQQQQGAFLESAKVFGNYYGTPRAPVEKALANGKDILLDVDWQGTQQVKASLPSDVVRIFILPPNIAELERRLFARGQDSAEIVQDRMSKADDEISHYAEYDYVIVNKDMEESLVQITAILQAERLKHERQIGLSDFVHDLYAELEQLS